MEALAQRCGRAMSQLEWSLGLSQTFLPELLVIHLERRPPLARRCFHSMEGHLPAPRAGPVT